MGNSAEVGNASQEISTTRTIPVVLFGQLPEVTDPLTSSLLPDVDVTHLIQSVSTAATELPAIVAGHPASPSSGKGSNLSRPLFQQRAPVAVIIGGGFTSEEFEEIWALEGVRRVPFIRADNSRVPEREWPPFPLYAARSAERIKNTLREHGVLDGESRWEVKRCRGEGEVWFY